MKEITVKFHDSIADNIKANADQIGLSPEELIRFIVGRWVQMEFMGRFGPMAGPIVQSIPSISTIGEKMVRDAASRGEIKCKNCTFPLTPEDIDNGTCHTCHSPIDFSVGGMQ